MDKFEINLFSLFTAIIFGVVLGTSGIFIPQIIVEMNQFWHIVYYILVTLIIMRVLDVFVAARLLIESYFAYIIGIFVASWGIDDKTLKGLELIKAYPAKFGIAAGLAFIILTAIAIASGPTKTIGDLKLKTDHHKKH